MGKRPFNTPQTGLPNIKLCPNCGFPNKNTDTKCCYCETLINHPTSLPPGKWFKWFFAHLKWNWKLKIIRAKKSTNALGKVAGALVGLALCIVGSFLFTSSVLTKNFSNGILSLFFLLYGVFTLKNLLKK